MATTAYTSRRQYLSQTELAQYADITITNPTEADDQISRAEEIVDAYVGFQEKFVQREVKGKLTNVSTATLYDTSGDTPFTLQDNYWTYCEIEIIAGTGAGQREIISSSSQDNKSVTVRTAFSTTPDTTSIYRIYQLGKFPRDCDYFYEPESETYYKHIPEAVKRAIAAQMEFIVAQGTDYFASDKMDMQSESIDTYSYSKGGANGGPSALVKMIAPKARAILDGITNRTGEMTVDDGVY